MPKLTSGQIIDLLARNEADKLIGAEETEQVEFKIAPHPLTENRSKWELAKDIAGFANRRGGVIVVGIECERRSNEIAEIAAATRRVRKAVVDLQQHRSVIDSWIYPRPQNVDLRWYPPEQSQDMGILVIEIPPQDENDFPFIVREMREPEAEFRGAVGIPRRDMARVVWDTAQDLHRQIKYAATVRTSRTGNQPARDRAIARIDESEKLQEWETKPVYFIQALPPPGPEILPDFYDAVRDSIVQYPALRPNGFAVRWRVRTETLEGGLVAKTEDGLTWIDPDGLMTQGLLVAEDTLLGWYYNQGRHEGSPLILHPVAVVETTLEFFRFLYSQIRPRAGRGSWSYRILCRRFRSHRVALPAEVLNSLFIVRAPNIASSDAWDRTFGDVGTPTQDAYQALQQIYALFGHPAVSIPLAENDSISEEKLIALRG